MGLSGWIGLSPAKRVNVCQGPSRDLDGVEHGGRFDECCDPPAGNRPGLGVNEGTCEGDSSTWCAHKRRAGRPRRSGRLSRTPFCPCVDAA